MLGRELIALGGARGVWDELQEAQLLFPDAEIGAVNEAGRDYRGRLAVWCSVHPEKFGEWQRAREMKGLNTDYKAVTRKPVAGARFDLLKANIWPGCSGLYLCQIAAICFRYTRIVLCGMPLTTTPHYFDDKAWTAAKQCRRGWKEAVQQPELRDKIRSMSGWTRELLGGPEDWLAEPVS